jgi:hypothetical protein
VEFDRHTLVLLVRPPDAPELTEEEALRLQDAHLANQARLGTRGTSSRPGRSGTRTTSGFVVSQCSVATPSRPASYASDPAVQAGRLGVEVLTWMVPVGNVRFESVTRPRSTADATG